MFFSDLKNLTDLDWILFRKNIYKQIETFVNVWNEIFNENLPSAVKIKIKGVLDQLQVILCQYILEINYHTKVSNPMVSKKYGNTHL